MSCTEIYGFNREGNAYWVADIRNAWRGGFAVWTAMEERHLPPKICYGREMSRLVLAHMDKGATSEIWGLAENKEVPEHERIVLFTTFDKCLVKKENLPRVIEAFRKFGGETSLPEQADVLEKLLEDDNCIAVGWNQTSVSCDTWTSKGGCIEESGESVPYNCLTMDGHYWLFDELNSTEEATP